MRFSRQLHQCQNISPPIPRRGTCVGITVAHLHPVSDCWTMSKKSGHRSDLWAAEFHFRCSCSPSLGIGLTYGFRACSMVRSFVIRLFSRLVPPLSLVNHSGTKSPVWRLPSRQWNGRNFVSLKRYRSESELN